MKKLLFAFLLISAGCGPASVCDYQLPPGYHLAQTGAGKYAICKSDDFFGNSFLDKDFSFFGEPDFHWRKDDDRRINIYDDSCQAKGAAKAFFDFQAAKSFKILGTYETLPKVDTPKTYFDPYLEENPPIMWRIDGDSVRQVIMIEGIPPKN